MRRWQTQGNAMPPVRLLGVVGVFLPDLAVSGLAFASKAETTWDLVLVAHSEGAFVGDGSDTAELDTAPGEQFRWPLSSSIGFYPTLCLYVIWVLDSADTGLELVPPGMS